MLFKKERDAFPGRITFNLNSPVRWAGWMRLRIPGHSDLGYDPSSYIYQMWSKWLNLYLRQENNLQYVKFLGELQQKYNILTLTEMLGTWSTLNNWKVLSSSLKVLWNQFWTTQQHSSLLTKPKPEPSSFCGHHITRGQTVLPIFLTLGRIRLEQGVQSPLRNQPQRENSARCVQRWAGVCRSNPQTFWNK